MSLREDLLAVPGIAAADLDGDHTTPAGVRVRLAPGADADAVGREVQRILAEHGMRSHMTEAEKTEPGTTAEVPRKESEIASDPEIPADMPPVAVSTSVGDAPPPPPGAMRAAVGAEVVQMPGLQLEEPVEEYAAGPGVEEALSAVGVEEARTGVTVRVTTDQGRQIERSVASAGPMVDIAIVEAVGALLASPPPDVVAVNDHLIDGTEVVLVVVEHSDGTRASGSCVVEVGRPFAVGTAAWKAVSEQV